MQIMELEPLTQVLGMSDSRHWQEAQAQIVSMC